MSKQVPFDLAAAGAGALPGRRRIYISGQTHPEIRVAATEVEQTPTKREGSPDVANPPIRLYDASGPWGDPDRELDPRRGLGPLRGDWIAARGDSDLYEGRVPRPTDDGHRNAEARDRAGGDGTTQGNAESLHEPPPGCRGGPAIPWRDG